MRERGSERERVGEGLVRVCVCLCVRGGSR